MISHVYIINPCHLHICQNRNQSTFIDLISTKICSERKIHDISSWFYIYHWYSYKCWCWHAICLCIAQHRYNLQDIEMSEQGPRCADISPYPTTMEVICCHAIQINFTHPLIYLFITARVYHNRSQFVTEWTEYRQSFSCECQTTECLCISCIQYIYHFGFRYFDIDKANHRNKKHYRIQNEQSYPHHNSLILIMSFLTITRVNIYFAKYGVAINVDWFVGKHHDGLGIMKSQHVIDRKWYMSSFTAALADNSFHF